jgi:hypothetical protein
MSLTFDRRIPTRADMFAFEAKAAIFRALRFAREFVAREHVQRHTRGKDLAEAPVIARTSSPLWSGVGGLKEHDLTAGKIHNLRQALRGIDGIEVPAGTLFGFWRQVGRASRARGFVEGRELREGCMVRSVGGGLCQLSNALYEAALAAGFEIVERHAHSRIVPGSRGALARDATVFWNYVDLRFRSAHAFRIEARLTGSDLEVVFRAASGGVGANGEVAADRAAAHDCTKCGETRCRLNDAEMPAQARPTAWLVDACWPEHAALFRERAGAADALFLPSRGNRRLWPTALCGSETDAPLLSLMRRLAVRRAGLQGAGLQATLLRFDRRIAHAYAKQLSHRHTHLVVSQSLLPHLWRAGILAGRTFEVLMERLPMAALQARLDAAATRWPESPTLADFRAPPEIVEAEMQALEAADRLHTPHRLVAEAFPEKTVLLDWATPAKVLQVRRGGRKILFPASPLGRKGAYALQEALNGLDATLLVSGGATEGESDFWHGLDAQRVARGAWPEELACVVLPAIVEHQPRALITALAAGIPVVATAACGLGPQPRLTLVPNDDGAALRAAIEEAMGEVRLDLVPLHTSPLPHGGILGRAWPLVRRGRREAPPPSAVEDP